MGAYLSSPVTDKNSCDKSCSGFTYGASSMQGWRINQEDAHNCIPDLDVNTAMFAVYDGHGGAEVAQYCSKHLPQCIKESEHYTEGNLDAALTDSFLKIDSTLVQEDVIKELKLLAGDDENEDEDEDDDPVGRGEADELRAEASVPLEEVLAKYQNASGNAAVRNLRKKDHIQSPVLKSKKGPADEETGPSSSCGPEGDSPSSTVSNGGDPKALLTNGVADSSESSEKKTTSGDAKDFQNIDGTSSPDGAGDGSSSAGGKGSSSSASDEISLANASGDSDTTAGSGKAGGSGSSKGSDCVAEVSSSTEYSTTIKQQGDSSSSVANLNDEGPSGSGRVSSSKGGKNGQKIGEKASVDEDDDDDDEEGDDEESEWEDLSGEEEEEEDSEEECMDTEGDEIAGMDMSNEEPGSDSGCTACVALLRGDKLVVANAGDSRCVLCRAGLAIELSFDHKPEDDIEKTRIEQAGGKVTMDGRVNGGLNLSRALGDHFYKRSEDLPPEKQMITALPDIKSITLEPEDQFFIVACDGIWNSMSSQEAVDFVAERMKDPAKKIKPSLICEEMFDHCLASSTYGDGTGCDNMTAIIVVFDDSRWQTPMHPKRCVSDLSPVERSSEKRPRVEETGKKNERQDASINKGVQAGAECAGKAQGAAKEKKDASSAQSEAEVTGSNTAVDEFKTVAKENKEPPSSG